MQLFARGPNVKRVVDNFIHLDKGYASFVQQGFVSELYSGLDDIFIEDIGEYDASFEAIYELALTPPYETKRRWLNSRMLFFTCRQKFRISMLDGHFTKIE